VALVHCLRVEFRHHFVFVRDTGAYNLALFTSHQERLGISIFNEYQKFKAFRKLNNLTPFLDVHLRRQKRTPYVEMMSARLSMCVHPAVRVCPSCCPCVSVLLSVCVRPVVRVCPPACPCVSVLLSEYVHPPVRVCPSCCPCASARLSACIHPPVCACPPCCPCVSVLLSVCDPVSAN